MRRKLVNELMMMMMTGQGHTANTKIISITFRSTAVFLKKNESN